MMSEPKPFASLSSGLLARKGQARPAMRPQGFTGGYASLAGIEDLGWNDMGHMPEPMADVHPLHEDDQIQPPPEGVPPGATPCAETGIRAGPRGIGGRGG
jgi:hypothetical protein